MKYIYTIAFIVLFLFNFYFIFRNRSLGDQNDLQTDKMNNLIKLYHNKLLIQIENGNSIDISSNSTLKDVSGRKTLLSVINNNQKLIFRFTELNCGNCIEHEIPILKKMSKKIGEDNIIILASYQHSNTLKILKEKYKLEFQTFNLPISNLSENKIESLNMPYFFMVNNSMIGNSTFVPEKTLPLLTIDYLELMAKTIKSN